MLWKELSNESKSIIEWVESPISNKKLVITVEKNKRWFMECPAWSGNVDIEVTEKIFNEIKEYIVSDKNLEVIENSNEKLVFTLVDGIKLH